MNPSPYDTVELSEEEIKAAILEGKKRKYFHERSKEYWQNLEAKKIKDRHVTNL